MQHEGEGGRGCESESAREIMQLAATPEGWRRRKGESDMVSEGVSNKDENCTYRCVSGRLEIASETAKGGGGGEVGVHAASLKTLGEGHGDTDSDTE
jgi:hypothetical protein